MQGTASSILCALCGIKFIPNSGSICPTCTIKSIEDVTLLQGDSIIFCRYCNRYERPPWMHCERESQEMMSILLKKIKGLNKVEFQSASFVWTEEHSKRIKLKVLYNREINDKMKLQCVEVVEFVEKYSQCPDCRKKFTPHDWTAVVQVRQFANHKRTILSLQQNLIKNKMSEKFLKTETAQNGLDIFFSAEHDAQRLVDHLKGRYPTVVKNSKQLISHNEQNNTSTVKITFSVVIPKICKDDLIRIPIKLAKQLGSCSQALYCTKVASSLHFIDITNFKKVQINSTQYNKYEGLTDIFPLKTYGRTFSILDSQDRDAESQHRSAIYGLIIMKEDEYKQIYSRSFVTDQPGRDVLGFDLTQMEGLQGIKDLPDYFVTQKVKSKEEKKKARAKKRQKQAKERQQQSMISQTREKEEEFDDEDEDIWEDQQQSEQQVEA